MSAQAIEDLGRDKAKADQIDDLSDDHVVVVPLHGGSVEHRATTLRREGSTYSHVPCQPTPNPDADAGGQRSAHDKRPSCPKIFLAIVLVTVGRRVEGFWLHAGQEDVVHVGT